MRNIFKWIYNSKINTTVTVTFILMSVLPLIVAEASSFLTTRSALQEAAEAHVKTVSAMQERVVEDWFDHHFFSMGQSARQLQNISGDRAEIKKILLQIKKQYPDYGSMIYIDNENQTVISTNDKTRLSDAEKQFFDESRTKDAAVSLMMKAGLLEEPYLITVVNLREGNEMDGFLAGTLPMGALKEIIPYGEGLGACFLVDKKGNLITYISEGGGYQLNPGEVTQAPQIPPVVEGLKGSSGLTWYQKDNLKVLGSYSWLSELDILLVTLEDDKELLKMGTLNLQKSAIMGVVFIILLLPIALIGGRRISAPLVELATVVNEISTGNLKARVKPFKANYEIVNLGRQLNELANTLDRSMIVIKDQMDELKRQKQEIISQNEDVLKAYNKLTRANQSLQQLAITDQLTQTYNRRYFMDRLRNEILLSIRSRRPLSVVLIDIDYFKNINDTYGHKAGDQVLQGLVKILASLIRRSDLLARFGGEEFIILAPEADLPGALKLAEKIREGVEKHVFVIDDGSLKITISLGVAELKDFAGSPEKSEDQLILNADHCLYQAKGSGRNRVVG